MEKRAVVICTDKRGVFFGYTTDIPGETMKLERARMCLYWPASQKGVLGLAADGPHKGARVSQAVDGEFFGITCVLSCTDEAESAWEKAPWS